MARRTFKKAERDAYTPGTEVEWRNVGHWHAGVVIAGVRDDGLSSWQYVTVRHTGRNTRTISRGETVTPGPTAVRLPQS